MHIHWDMTVFVKSKNVIDVDKHAESYQPNWMPISENLINFKNIVQQLKNKYIANLIRYKYCMK